MTSDVNFGRVLKLYEIYDNIKHNCVSHGLKIF